MPPDPTPPTNTPPAPQPVPPPANQPPPPAPAPPPPDDDDDDDDDHGLNAAGHRALREVRRTLRRERANQRQALEQVSALQRQVETQATQLRSVDRLKHAILEHAVGAAAAGRLADPTDAMRMVDLSDCQVGDDGRVDMDRLKAKVEELIRAKPYLSTNGHRPTTLPGGGARTPPAGGFGEVLRQAIRGG